MIKDVAYFTRGELKREVLEQVLQPKTPTQVKKLLNKHRASISRILVEMERKGYVRCLNADDKMARYYQVTEKGKKILEEIKKVIHEKEG